MVHSIGVGRRGPDPSSISGGSAIFSRSLRAVTQHIESYHPSLGCLIAEWTTSSEYRLSRTNAKVDPGTQTATIRHRL